MKPPVLEPSPPSGGSRQIPERAAALLICAALALSAGCTGRPESRARPATELAPAPARVAAGDPPSFVVENGHQPFLVLWRDGATRAALVSVLQAGDDEELWRIARYLAREREQMAGSADVTVMFWTKPPFAPERIPPTPEQRHEQVAEIRIAGGERSLSRGPFH
jgi:hypothetical protein